MIPRQTLRPNLHHGPGLRPAVPTSSARMMKSGFQPPSTLYVPSKARKHEEPEHIVIPPYPVVSTFIFTDDEVTNSPSRIQHGISQEEELKLRRIGTLFIRDLRRKLNESSVSKSQRQV